MGRLTSFAQYGQLFGRRALTSSPSLCSRRHVELRSRRLYHTFASDPARTFYPSSESVISFDAALFATMVASSSKMVIDLTNGSSDLEDQVTAPMDRSDQDDSVIFVNEIATGSSSTVSTVNGFTHQHQSLGLSGRHGLRIGEESEPGFTIDTEDPVAIDSDMGDETRQLISEMLENDDKETLQAYDDAQSVTSFEEEAPLASLSLVSPEKRPRGRPRKLILGTRAPNTASTGGNDDDDDDDDPEDNDDDEADEDDVEAEPDSIYVSANLSRALALTVRADVQLWNRILRFEPIPLEELTSCASKGASAFAQNQREGYRPRGKEAGDDHEGPTQDFAKAWKEWNYLLAGSQKRLELAIQSWADEQGICSFFDEGRHDKRKAKARQRTSRQGSPSLSSEDDFSSPTKKRRSRTISARGTRRKGKAKART